MTDKLHRLKLIATGTGRCGTRFVSKLLTSAGLTCGHERFFDFNGLDFAKEQLANHWYGTYAESSWCAAPFLSDETLKDAFLVHLVRHPKTYIGSLLKIWPPGYAHTSYTFGGTESRTMARLIDLPPPEREHWELHLRAVKKDTPSLKGEVDKYLHGAELPSLEHPSYIHDWLEKPEEGNG